MRHGSLFSGIGGFDAAAAWLGWQNILQVENNPFCTAILASHFPHTHRHQNIEDFDGKAYQGKIDIISGGFPCQPFSLNGNRQGWEDPRALWPQMLRVIREIKPRYVVAENVIGLISKGIESVALGLENEGFNVTLLTIPAAAVGAYHHRARVWIVADSQDIRREKHEEPKQQLRAVGQELLPPMPVWTGQAPAQCKFCGMAARLSLGVDYRKRMIALGNAIVPQVAYEIFKIIGEHDRLNRRNDEGR